MGVVYLGRRRKRWAAVKVLRSDLSGDCSYRERFRREAEAAARVVSTHTARVVEIRDQERVYLATEYIEGPTLAQAIAEQGPMPAAPLREFGRGVAHAIAAIHAAGVTHRDLTPANVILAGSRPVVIDFGIARATDNRPMTATGWSMGTPGWMAPEQARGDRAGPAADVFAWGLLVAFAGTGRAPFGIGRPDAVVYRIVHEAPDVGGLDHALVPLVIAALEKDPHRRPRPEAVLHELLALDGAAPPTAVAPPAVVPTAPASPRPEQPAPVPSAPRDRRSLRRAAGALAVLALLAAAAVGGVWLARLGDDSSAAAGPEAEPASTRGSVATTTARTAPATSAPAPPSAPAPAGSTEEYCDAAEDYYEELDDARSDLGLFPSQDDVDDVFLEFAAEHQELGEQLRAAAPAEIADDVDVIVDAFELAGEGDLSGYDSVAYDAARGRLRGFEIVRCFIVRLD